MNITVIGAGAVGGYFGSRLHDAGVNVTFLVRERRFNQLKEEGLTVESINGDTYIKEPNIVSDVTKIEACDLVILSVKGYHMDGIYPQLEVLVKKGAKILPLLNGMEHYELLKERFGEESVIGGLCYIVTTLDNGRIVHTSKLHDIVYGPLVEEQATFCEELLPLFEKANMNVTLSKNILNEIWSKYAYITAFSGITTSSRLEIGMIRDTPEALELFKELGKEMYQLAKAYGVDLGDSLVQSFEDRAHQFPRNATSSMHQDLRKGLPLELESLQGGAIRMGEAKGIHLDKVKVIYALLKPFEHGRN